MRIGLAFKAAWKALFDSEFAARLAALLAGGSSGSQTIGQRDAGAASEAAAPTAPAPQRSEAITLLAALQREARFVDLVREPLDQYSDAQIGAAAREVLRDCDQVLDRMFGIEPLVEQAEGETLEVPADFDAGCYRLSGRVEGQPPYRGRLVHHGWKASHCKMPQWSGSRAASRVIAPAEVEIASSANGGQQDS